MAINTDFLPDIGDQSQRREQELAALARRQHGVVGYWQLVELGFGKHAIQHRADAGRLHRLYRGVYAVGHRRLTRNGHWLAATLALGPLAVASHRTAAAIHGVLWPRDGWPHVTVPATGRPKRRGIVVHQVTGIPEPERTVIDAIPATSLARTLLDLARTKDRLLPYAIDEAADNDILDFKAINALEGRNGIRALRQAIANYEPTPHWTRSRLEKRFFKLMRKHGIPLPAVNNWVAGYEVDMVWHEQRLIAEIDGGDIHDRPSARRKDPLRDANLQLAGYRTYRVPETELILRPDDVAATVKRFLTRTEALRAR